MPLPEYFSEQRTCAVPTADAVSAKRTRRFESDIDERNPSLVLVPLYRYRGTKRLRYVKLYQYRRIKRLCYVKLYQYRNRK